MFRLPVHKVFWVLILILLPCSLASGAARQRSVVRALPYQTQEAVAG